MAIPDASPESAGDLAASLVAPLEAVLFASPEPMSVPALARVFGWTEEGADGAASAPESAPEARDTEASPAAPAVTDTPAAEAAPAAPPVEAPKKRRGRNPNGTSGSAGSSRQGAPDPRIEALKQALVILADRTAADGRGVRLAEVAGGWQFLSREEYFPLIQKVAKTRAEEKLSPAVIETLSVVAYKQPVTRADVDAIRGAQSGPHIRTLMDKGLVRVAGRADLPGSPFTYGTTRLFLKHFGLRTARDLPDPKDLARVLAEQGRSAERAPS